MVLSLGQIFREKAGNVDAGEEFTVTCSYLEVYNEVRPPMAAAAAAASASAALAGWLRCSRAAGATVAPLDRRPCAASSRLGMPGA